jgi:electron transport complex protein RnfA
MSCRIFLGHLPVPRRFEELKTPRHELCRHLRYAARYSRHLAIYTYLLLPRGLGYLETIVFILVIASLVQLVEIALKKYVPALYTALGVYLPLITTNCAVLGVTIANIDSEYKFVPAMFNAFGSGLGFLLAMVIFSASAATRKTATRPSRSRACR